tara:strand:- start:674 stop:2122 length:1449 start_codon:yes stop_codon:yes gene_type:complete
MAVDKSQVVFDGMIVEQQVNTVTGETYLYTADGNTQLAVGQGSDWTITNESAFRSAYNTVAGNSATSATFESTFQASTSTFNEARSEVLNTANEGNDTVLQTLYENGIPGAQNPTTGQYVNNDGTVTDGDPFSNSPNSTVSATNPNTGTTNPSLNNTGTDSEGSTLTTSDTTGGADSVDSDTSVGSGVAGSGSVQVGGSSEILRYPTEMPDAFEYDFISIQAKEYAPTGLSPQTGDLSQSNVGGETFETVILPMQPNLSESNAVNYQDSSANFLQLAGGKLAEGAIEGLGSGDFAKIGEAGKQALANAKSVASDPATKAYLSAYFAGQAVGTNLVGRSTGMVVNPNMTVLFSGPTLRSFQFSFPMTPRSEEEARNIRKIIRAFKRNSLPQRAESSAFLMTPRIFLLKYIFSSNSTTEATHPFLNKFKPCMLTNFNVNYTPDNSYMTLRDGSMTRYTIDLTFKEVVPNFADEYSNIEEQNMGF